MDLVSYFIQLGYIGVFILSVIGSASVFFPIPYTISYYLLGATLNPFFIAIAGGLGSAVGELVGYIIGYFGQKFIDEERKKRMFYLVKIVDRFGYLIIFLFALTPLPDDLLFIPLGILRYNFLKVFIPSLLGKFVMAYALAYSGKISFELINVLFGESTWLTMLIMTVLLGLALIVMLRLDWEKVFKKYLEKD